MLDTDSIATPIIGAAKKQKELKQDEIVKLTDYYHKYESNTLENKSIPGIYKVIKNSDIDTDTYSFGPKQFIEIDHSGEPTKAERNQMVLDDIKALKVLMQESKDNELALNESIKTIIKDIESQPIEK